jgi:hypothetical protein
MCCDHHLIIWKRAQNVHSRKDGQGFDNCMVFALRRGRVGVKDLEKLRTYFEHVPYGHIYSYHLLILFLQWVRLSCCLGYVCSVLFQLHPSPSLSSPFVVVLSSVYYVQSALVTYVWICKGNFVIKNHIFESFNVQIKVSRITLIYGTWILEFLRGWGFWSP